MEQKAYEQALLNGTIIKFKTHPGTKEIILKPEEYENNLRIRFNK
jgi:hypothetical protein